MGPSEGELPGREIKICQNFCKPSPITVICPSDITFTAWEPRKDMFSFSSGSCNLCTSAAHPSRVGDGCAQATVVIRHPLRDFVHAQGLDLLKLDCEQSLLFPPVIV